MPATIPTTRHIEARTGDLVWHAPGCNHVAKGVEPTTHDEDVEFLRSIQAEAKDLNTRNPVAPCLRRAIR